MITLSAKVFGKRGKLVVSPSYISNGHWAIMRSAVKNEKDYACAAVVASEKGSEITDELVLKAIPCFNGTAPLPAKFSWARKVYAGHDQDYAIFECSGTGQTVWFDRDYIERLDCMFADFYPSQENLQGFFVTEDRRIAIMPCRQVTHEVAK